ncbi:MAG: TIGR00266 family protein [Planctomycetes bacterium]|nr:TIGR00266 family protein [Planctomycetota bacterium]
MASDGGWYYVSGKETTGPVTRSELLSALPGAGGSKTLVWGPGVPEWTEASHVAALGVGATGPVAPPAAPTKTRRSDEIDYELFGDDMQFVEITLDPGEVVIAEAGGMMYMTDGIEMQTVFGDPSKNQGFFGKLFDAGKRMITGESLFLTTFGAMGQKRERVAFASPYPGKIIPMHLDELGGELICQKDAFLCAARGVHIGIAFQRKILTGLFGGEGFILQRLTGDGLAFVHAGGTIHRIDLDSGEVLRIDTGCLVALQPSVDYDIQMSKGIKNAIFGGEGLFLATLRGPGAVWLQSLPFTRLAGRVLANIKPGGGKGEGSVLGGFATMFKSR